MKNTSPSSQTEWEIHKPVIETMKSIGFGLLKDGETFYKLGYELDPRGNTTFTMSQAYEIHKALASERTRLLSVESMKMEEKIKKLKEKYLEEPYKCDGGCCDAHESSEQALDDLRQSILSEMEKGE